MISAGEMRTIIEASVEFEPNTGCWLWARGATGDGYGCLGHKGWPRGAHRASWLAFGNSLPPGLLIMHRCDTRVCVNPDHLRLGTYADNRADCVSKGRAPAPRPGIVPPLTQCRRGHPFDVTNTFIDARGDRGCIICRRERGRRARAPYRRTGAGVSQ
jgi:hypothetical protein